MLNRKQLANLRDRARLLRKQIDSDHMKLAELVYQTYYEHAKDGPVWACWGYETWNDYVKSELQLSPARAWRYARVHERFAITLKGKWHRRDLLPFEKMSLLEPVVTGSNVVAQLKRAKDMSVPELREALRRRPRGKETKPFVKRFSADVTPEQLETIAFAVEVVQETYNLPTRGEALYRMALDVIGTTKTRSTKAA